MIIDKEVIEKLGNAFPRSFINSHGEFIANGRTNLYFNLANCESETDIKCKILEWFSRDAFKTQPFNSDRRNDEYHMWVLRGVNEYLGTTFIEDDIDTIYCALGNAINHDLTVKFVESGYDMALLQD